MRQKGNTRQIDGMGRVVIPKDFRNTLGIKDFDSLEIFLEEDRIVIRKHIERQECALCSAEEQLTEVAGKFICDRCLEKIKSL